MGKISQILSKLRYIRRLKQTSPELYELNSLWHDELMLLQELQWIKRNGEARLKVQIEVQTLKESQLLSLKIPKVTPETHPCGVLINTLEA
jgi:hypothetical protein